MLLTLIVMNAFYTAKLASFLTVENKVSLVNGVKDLYVENLKPGVAFGMKGKGSTMDFFVSTNDTKYKEMYKWLMDHPKNLMDDNEKGVEKAAEGKYAFLMESSTIEYQIERNCKITQVGLPLDEKSYGVAMKKSKLNFNLVIFPFLLDLLLSGSPYRNVLSEGVLHLHESGDLSRLKIKW